MPEIGVNGVQLFYELTGTGDIPIVLVHGSWSSHSTWNNVMQKLAASFKVLSYDRRGHSASQRLASQGSIHEDMADLAALIEQLGLAPAWVIGNSFGGVISLRLAEERPELFRGLMVHEPPFLSLLAGNEALSEMLNEVNSRIEAVLARIAAGDHAGAAELFIDTVAVGPGSWARLPAEQQSILIKNAPTFLDEAQDADAYTINLEALKTFSQPTLLSTGTQSPPMFMAILETLLKSLPNASLTTLPEAGHIPHQTHPELYAKTIATFIQEHQT